VSRSVEHKCALSVAITEIEGNPGHASVVVVPGFSVWSEEDSCGSSINALDFFPCHSDSRLSRQVLGRRNNGSLIFSHCSGCASRAREPPSDCQHKQLFHRLHYKPLCDGCTWKRAVSGELPLPMIPNGFLTHPNGSPNGSNFHNSLILRYVDGLTGFLAVFSGIPREPKLLSGLVAISDKNVATFVATLTSKNTRFYRYCCDVATSQGDHLPTCAA